MAVLPFIQLVMFYPHSSCSAALCDDPPIIVNGMRTFTGNSVGDTATYSCDPGFKLIGESTTTCTIALDGNSATFPDIPPPECMSEYFKIITEHDLINMA